ncbi:MAG: hypothetical protein R2792_17855 [Saprospiraceae bacterium]
MSVFGNLLRNNSKQFDDFTEYQVGLSLSRRFTTQKQNKKERGY